MFVGILIVFLLAVFQPTSPSPSAWSIAISMPDGSKRIIHLPAPASESDEDNGNDESCRNCFRIKTVDAGRRMLAESCADENCVPLVNSTIQRETIKPTSNYDFTQCGQTFPFSSTPIIKSIQLKISTSIKNVLRPAEYPWIARIESRANEYSRTMTLCGGTLIHPQWILTAAHCMIDSKNDQFYSTQGINVFLGHYNRLSRHPKQYRATPAFYIVHPKFRITRRSPAPIHDVALIRLSQPVPLSRWINTACLPESTDNLNEGTLAYTAGWGHTSPQSSAVDEPRKAKVKIAPRSCRQLMINPYLHICARSNRGNNICSGDSGSGLFVRAGFKNSNNQTTWKWHVFGVASFGLEECSERVNHDNAFASVPIDVDWIREMMNKF